MPRKASVTLGRLDLTTTEKFADNREVLLKGESPRGEGVPKVSSKDEHRERMLGARRKTP